MKAKILAIPVIAAFFFLSCNNNPDEQKQDAEETDSTLTNIDDIPAETSEDNEVSYNLPSPLQVAFVFKKSGAGFISTLPNNKSNTSRYNTSNYKKAVNFGIYSADLAYCLFHKKYQESKEYLKACKDMGSYLGLDKVFGGDHMAERFDKNISNDDSLIKIVSDVQMKTDLMFEENKQKHIKLLALTGAWTESIFIASEAYSKDKTKKIRTSLLEQLLLSETIIKALKSRESTEPEIPALISSIEKIHLIYNSIPAVMSAMVKDEEIDFNVLAISEAEMQPVIESVKQLRSEMVN